MLGLNTLRLITVPVWSWYWVLTVATAMLALTVWAYRFVFSGQRRGWAVVLLAIRLLVVLMCVLALLRPALIVSEKKKQSASLLLLFDASRSMLVQDTWSNQSRWELLRQNLEAARKDLKGLAEDLALKAYVFPGSGEAGEPDELDLAGFLKGEDVPLPAEPTGSGTPLGDAMEKVWARNSGRRPIAMLVLSDGAKNVGASPTAVARSMKDRNNLPIFTAGYGKESAAEGSKDISAKDLEVPPTVHAKTPLHVKGLFRARGFAGQRLPIRLLIDDKFQEKTLAVTPSTDGTAAVDLTYIPTTAGEIKVTLEAEPREGELIKTNNAISSFITVVKGGTSILYVEGKPRFWEPKYLNWAFDGAPDMHLDFKILQPPLEGGASQVETDWLDRSKYDVFILGNVPAAALGSAGVNRLQAAVNNGAGLLMIGGSESFGPGGWGESALAEIMPVEMRRGDPRLTGDIKMLPTPTGLSHYVMRLSSDLSKNAQIWEGLHALNGANAWTDVKGLNAGAGLVQVLAQGSSPTGSGVIPLLAAQDVGRGRSMAFAADTTWRWWMGTEEGQEHHRRFWRQLVLWLAHKEDAGEKQVRLELAKRRLALGEKQEIKVTALDKHGLPMKDVKFEVAVEGPKNKKDPVDVHNRDEAMRGTYWQTNVAGDYVATVRAVNPQSGVELGTARARFLVSDEDRELENPAADLSLLQSVAELSGGRYSEAERLHDLLQQIKKMPHHLETESLKEIRLWDRWPFFLLFVALLAAEWYLRKRKGLV